MHAAPQLSAQLIDQAPDLPVANVYRNRFGGLYSAYLRVGFDPGIDTSYVAVNRWLTPVRKLILSWIALNLQQAGIAFTKEIRLGQGHLNVDGHGSISAHVAKCETLSSGNPRWAVRALRRKSTDYNVIARMDHENVGIFDYYVIPEAALPAEGFFVSAQSMGRLAPYYDPDLAGLVGKLRG